MKAYPQVNEERSFPIECIRAVLVLLRETSHRMLFSNRPYSEKTRPAQWGAQFWRAKTMSKERAAALLTTGEIGQMIDKEYVGYVDRGLLETLTAAGLIRRFRVDGDPNVHHLMTPTSEYLLRNWDSIRESFTRPWVNLGLIKQMARQAAYEGLLDTYEFWDADVAKKRFSPKQGRLDYKTAVFGTLLLVLGASSEETALQLTKQASGAAWDSQTALMEYLDELGTQLYGLAYEPLLLSEFDSQVMWRRKQLNNTCGNLLQGSKPPTGTQWRKLNGPYVQTFFWNISNRGETEEVGVILRGLLSRMVSQDKIHPHRIQKVLLDFVRQARSGDLLRQEHWREFMPNRPSYSFYEGLHERIIQVTEEFSEMSAPSDQ